MNIVICGGGIMGVATAYFLSERGVTCTIVDRCGIACAASGRAGGFLARTWCDPFEVGPLARRSFDLHAQLAEKFPEIDYRRVDTLAVSGRDGLGKYVNSGTAPNWLDGSLHDVAHIGSTQDTAQVHPYKLTHSLFKSAADKVGTKLVIGTVEGIKVMSGQQKITGVYVNGELLPADIVVITMGPWSAQAAKWLRIPKIQNSRAHSVLLKPSKSVTAHALFVEYRQAQGRLKAPEVYPRPDGEVYVCGEGDSIPLPDDPSDIIPNEDSCLRLQQMAASLSSHLHSAELVKSSACYLPSSPDGVPVIGQISGVQKAYIAAGHSCWGILNGPATGEALAELILDAKTTHVDLSAFDPSRFH